MAERERLTERQRQTLVALEAGPRGAYPGLHMGVLNSLSLRGLVHAKYGLGSIAMPHTSVRWSLTDAGRATLQYDRETAKKEG